MASEQKALDAILDDMERCPCCQGIIAWYCPIHGTGHPPEHDDMSDDPPRGHGTPFGASPIYTGTMGR